MRPIDAAAAALAVAGVVVAAVIGMRTRSVRVASSAMLELWTAAGLLRLTADAAMTNLAVAAIIVVLRHVVAADLLARAPR